MKYRQCEYNPKNRNNHLQVPDRVNNFCKRFDDF